MRRLRERRGVSLKAIAAATKLSVAQLEALERNDLSRLPGGIFLRSIVRAYAREIGADPESAVQDCLAGLPPQAPEDHPDAPRGARPLLIGVLVLVVVTAVAVWSLLVLT
jgi:cytoskeletal protein RodZ